MTAADSPKTRLLSCPDRLVQVETGFRSVPGAFIESVVDAIKYERSKRCAMGLSPSSAAEARPAIDFVRGRHLHSQPWQACPESLACRCRMHYKHAILPDGSYLELAPLGLQPLQTICQSSALKLLLLLLLLRVCRCGLALCRLAFLP